jgi:hypothetical protein
VIPNAVQNTRAQRDTIDRFVSTTNNQANQNYTQGNNNFGISPSKKHNNTASKADGTGVERINVTIPNPLLMLNGNVQIQYLQEIVRNVIQRVDDIFHMR